MPVWSTGLDLIACWRKKNDTGKRKKDPTIPEIETGPEIEKRPPKIALGFHSRLFVDVKLAILPSQISPYFPTLTSRIALIFQGAADSDARLPPTSGEDTSGIIILVHPRFDKVQSRTREAK